MTHVHLGARNGYTTCGVFIPDLPGLDRYWIPGLGEEPPGPVTCPRCLAGKRAPVSSTTPRCLRMVTVYAYPKDFPREVLARESFIDASGQRLGEIIARGPDYAACRIALLKVNGDLYRLPRSPDDDPIIVETWI